jgi:hypothetical protein
MSDSYKTNLYLQGAPLPQGFKGTPQSWYEAILERIRIVAPFGFSTIVVGSLKPTSNQGPWLKDGTKWYVWSEDDADYVPLDISDSETPPYYVQGADPAGTPDADGNYLTFAEGGPEDGPLNGGPLLWFRLNGSGTGVNGIFIFVNGKWQGILRNYGSTADRPDTPANLEEYYDEDISTMIIWERGAWRTVDGARGDLKYVSWQTAEEALTYNPGWEVFGTDESEDAGLRGRLLVQATKNSASGSTTDLSTTGGVTGKVAFDKAGEEEHVLTDDEMPAHSHDLVASTTGNGGGGGFSGIGFPKPMSTDPTGGSQGHNNMPPTLACWLLRKQ